MQKKLIKPICFIMLNLLLLTGSLLIAQENTAESSVVSSQIQRLVDDLLSDRSHLKMGIAVLPFETSEGRSEARDLGEAAAILISENLVKNPNYSVAERAKLQSIMEEIGLSQTGMTENELEVGNLLNAEYIITGAVADLGARFLLAARMIEVETGNIMQSSSVEIPSKNFLNVSSKLVVVKKYSITSAFRSMIIPGWGQFYNDQPKKGSFLLITELLAVGATAASYTLYKQAKGQYDRSTDRQLSVQYFNEMDKNAQMNHIGGAVAGVIWFYAFVDSWVVAAMQIKDAQ